MHQFMIFVVYEKNFTLDYILFENKIIVPPYCTTVLYRRISSTVLVPVHITVPGQYRSLYANLYRYSDAY